MSDKIEVKYPDQLAKLLKGVLKSNRVLVAVSLDGNKTYEVGVYDLTIEKAVRTNIWLDLSKWSSAEKFIKDTHLLIDPVRCGLKWHVNIDATVFQDDWRGFKF